MSTSMLLWLRKLPCIILKCDTEETHADGAQVGNSSHAEVTRFTCQIKAPWKKASSSPNPAMPGSSYDILQ